MAIKDNPLGYSSIFDEIREVCKSFNVIQNSGAISTILHGRARVQVDAAVYAKKFEDSFRLKKHAWAILSDYANLFAHLFKRKNSL